MGDRYARAPMRIGLAGGGTDIAPFYQDYGGCSLTVAIKKYAYASFNGHPDDSLFASTIKKHLGYRGEISTKKDAENLSGLGGSAAFAVAVIGLLAMGRMSKQAVAEMAMDIERNKMKVAGGVQDFFASCFPRDTKILLDMQKVKDIGDIQIGDCVLSYNTQNGKKEIKKVVNVFERDSKDFIRIKFSNENELTCTPEHPIAVNVKGKIKWVKANNLQKDDECIQKLSRSLGLRIYNFKERNNGNRSEWAQKNWKKNVAFVKRINAHGGKKTSQEVIDMSIRAKAAWDDPTSAYHTEDYHRNKSLQAKKHNRNIRNDPVKNEIRSKKQSIQSKLNHQIRREKLGEEEYIKLQLRSLGNFYYTIGKGSKMNKLERKVSMVLRSVCPREFKYNGNGRLGVMIAKHVPDFVNVNGKKKVVEVYSRYWKENFHGGIEQWKIKCALDYGSVGYDVCFVEETEVKNIKALKDKIINFVFNPESEIVKITDIVKYSVRLFEKVYNIEVEDNNNYFAHGILVHNCQGGFNYFEYNANDVNILPMLRTSFIDKLENSLLLFFTTKRDLDGSGVQDDVIMRMNEGQNIEALLRVKELANESRRAIRKERLHEFGEILDISWTEKKKLSKFISNDNLDELYDSCKNKGAIAGKLMGAGGGGYMLLLCSDFSKCADYLTSRNFSPERVYFDWDGLVVGDL